MASNGLDGAMDAGADALAAAPAIASTFHANMAVAADGHEAQNLPWTDFGAVFTALARAEVDGDEWGPVVIGKRQVESHAGSLTVSTNRWVRRRTDPVYRRPRQRAFDKCPESMPTPANVICCQIQRE